MTIFYLNCHLINITKITNKKLISRQYCFLVPLIDVFHGAAFTVSSSMASKLVDNTELGMSGKIDYIILFSLKSSNDILLLLLCLFCILAQLNSVRGMLETLAPIIVYPLYNQVYKLTFETLPGAFFLITAAITVPVVILFG